MCLTQFPLKHIVRVNVCCLLHWPENHLGDLESILLGCLSESWRCDLWSRAPSSLAVLPAQLFGCQEVISFALQSHQQWCFCLEIIPWTVFTETETTSQINFSFGVLDILYSKRKTSMSIQKMPLASYLLRTSTAQEGTPRIVLIYPLNGSQVSQVDNRA